MMAIEADFVPQATLSPERARVLAAVMESVHVALGPLSTPEQRNDALGGLNLLAQLVCGTATRPGAVDAPRRSEVIDRIAEALTRYANQVDARRNGAASAPNPPRP
jgi:hypothetical protein